MNITKKRLLKIKKTNNQSRKKNYAKDKKKYKKNKSFRRRKKHNLRNKSLKSNKRLFKRKKRKKGGSKSNIHFNQSGGDKIHGSYYNQLKKIGDTFKIIDVFRLSNNRIIKGYTYIKHIQNIIELDEVKDDHKEWLKANVYNMGKSGNWLKRYFGKLKTDAKNIKKPKSAKNIKQNKVVPLSTSKYWKELPNKLKELAKARDERVIIKKDGANYLLTDVFIHKNTKTELPLWKYINSIAILTETKQIIYDESEEASDKINIFNFKKLKDSIKKIMEKINGKKSKIKSPLKNLIIFHKDNNGETFPLLNWNATNHYKKYTAKNDLKYINRINKIVQSGNTSIKKNKTGGGNIGDQQQKFNNFIQNVMDSHKSLGASKLTDKLYATFINKADKMRDGLILVEENKNALINLRKKLKGELLSLKDNQRQMDEFDPQQSKNDLVKLFVKKREQMMNTLLADVPSEKRNEIKMKFQKWEKKKNEETDAVDAQLKISQGKEASTSVPKTPGSFSMGNYFNAMATDKYPNDQYIVPESLDPWGITIDPEKNGLFARFNIRQHPYQFDKDNQVINAFNLVDTPEWLQFVGDSLEDRKGITPAYKPPMVVGATTDEAISKAEGQKNEADEAVDKARSGKRSFAQGVKLGLRGNLSKAARKKADVKEKEKAASTAEKVVDAKKKKRKEIEDKKGKDTGKGKEPDEPDETKGDEVLLSKDPVA